MFSKTIRARIYLASAAVAIFLVLQTSFVVVDANSVFTSADDIRDRQYPITVKSLQMQQSVIQVQQWLTDISATRGLDGLNDGFDEAAKHAAKVRTLLGELAGLDPANASTYQGMLPVFEDYYTTGKRMAQAYVDQGPTGGNRMMAAFDDAAAALADHVAAELTMAAESADRILNAQVDTARTMRNWSLAFGALYAVLLGAFVLIIIRSVVTPLEQMRDLAKNLVEGDHDLTRRLVSGREDEIGQVASWINAFLDKIQNTIGVADESSNALHNSVAELADNAERTKEGIAQQLASAQEVSTAMHAMTTCAQEVAQSSAETAEHTHAATEEGENSVQMMQETARIIDSLAAEMERSESDVNSLGDETRNIGSVLDVIRDISEQTNLLALNAAIEAARAGEMGRGFAVVADEVRTLASRTQTSANEIRDMINRLQDRSQRAVTSMSGSRDKAHASVEAVNKLGSALNAINGSVHEISSHAAHIADSAEEQSKVSTDVENNVGAITRNAGDNLERANRFSEQSAMLRTMADKLHAQMSQFSY